MRGVHESLKLLMFLLFWFLLKIPALDLFPADEKYLNRKTLTKNDLENYTKKSTQKQHKIFSSSRITHLFNRKIWSPCQQKFSIHSIRWCKRWGRKQKLPSWCFKFSQKFAIYKSNYHISDEW